MIYQLCERGGNFVGRRKKQPNDGFEFYDFLRAVLFSVLAAVLVVTALIALFALVLSFITIPPVVLSGMTIATLMLAGFVSGYLAAKSIRKKGVLVGAVCGAAISILLFLLAGILFECTGWQLITKTLVVMAAASIGGVLGVNSRKKYR